LTGILPKDKLALVHWLSTNYQWVVAVVLMPIILLLLKRWAESPKKTAGAAPTQAALSAEGSSVSNSPVAGCSGNIQNVNAPVFNVNIRQPAPAPAQAEPVHAAPAARQRFLPHIVATGVHVARVSQVSQGVWSESYPEQDAFIVQFTNEARMGGQNVGGLVKAQLIYRDGVRELRRITGCWLNQVADMTEFRVDDTHGLMVGLMLGQQFTTVGKRRITVALGTDEIPQDANPLHGFDQGTVSVRLTHTSTGDVIYEGQFQLNTRPPEIIRL
jgi:hypothetical protein